MESYDKLKKLHLKVFNLQHMLNLATWDSRAKMPPKGAPARGAAVGELKQYVHDLLSTSEMEGLLAQAEVEVQQQQSIEDIANVREMKRIYYAESSLPDAFIARRARTVAEATVAWYQARKANNFQLFLPKLQEMVLLMREEAACRTAAEQKYLAALGKSPAAPPTSIYESLFHIFEPGMSLADVDAIFDEMKTWLPQLLATIVQEQGAREAADTTAYAYVHKLSTLRIPEAKQHALNLHCMNLLQYDFDAGRLDVSPHPFTSLQKTDARVTTHYDEHNYKKTLFATIHETGHGRYEQCCGPRALLGQPVCNARSLMIHETQSRFYEVMVGRSGAFATYLQPHLNHFYVSAGENVNGEDAKAQAVLQDAFATTEKVRYMHQRVEPGLIRLEADEVCYPLHIILRYEIERALVEGTMEAEDVPRVWNEKMKQYLDLDPGDRDDLGCLQDMHWSQGFFGYFPTYTLGSMFAAQLMATIRKELGEEEVNRCIATGELEPIFAKQREKVWDVGCVYETEELMQRASGEKLNPKYFREHLERRYLRRED